jgi:hypothetical protein
MKNVAATSGQSVSFTTLLFAFGIAWEGIWAGSDNELNFYRRPPKAILAPYLGTSSQSQNTRFITACKRKMRLTQNYLPPERGRLALLSHAGRQIVWCRTGSPPASVLNCAACVRTYNFSWSHLQ